MTFEESVFTLPNLNSHAAAPSPPFNHLWPAPPPKISTPPSPLLLKVSRSRLKISSRRYSEWGKLTIIVTRLLILVALLHCLGLSTVTAAEASNTTHHTHRHHASPHPQSMRNRPARHKGGFITSRVGFAEHINSPPSIFRSPIVEKGRGEDPKDGPTPDPSITPIRLVSAPTASSAVNQNGDDEYEEVIEYYDDSGNIIAELPSTVSGGDKKVYEKEMEDKLSSFLAATAEHRQKVEDRERLRLMKTQQHRCFNPRGLIHSAQLCVTLMLVMDSGSMRQEALASDVLSSDAEVINHLLNKGDYDWRVRPPGTNLSIPGSHGPVIVTVNMLIRSISKIDDVNMEYSVQLTFRESWVDGRLAYGLPRDAKPDFIILTAGQKNEKQAHKHMIDKPNVLIRVHKDGQILYSVRISLILSCPMHLQMYPMDVQTCLIDLASYAYTSDDIEYQWKTTDPVQLKEGLESSLPSFQLGSVNTTYCTSNTNTGVYSCLRTVLQLRRQFSYYLLQLYIPSTLLVIVSWVSFWLDRTAVPARVTLGVTTLLTMTTQTSGINAKLPPVSYSKAIDIWCGACLTFIFGALLEFACVTYMASRMFYRAKLLQQQYPPYGPIPSLVLQRPATSSTKSFSLASNNQFVSRHSRPRSLVLSNHPPTIAIQRLAVDEDEWDSGGQGNGEEQVWVRRQPTGGDGRKSPLMANSLSSRELSAVVKRRAQSLIVEEALGAGPYHAYHQVDPMLGEGEGERGQSPSMPKGAAIEFGPMASPSLSTPLKEDEQRRSSATKLLKRLPPVRWIRKQFEIQDRAKRIDYISRYLFPFAFIFFNLVYWLRYSRYELSWPWA